MPNQLAPWLEQQVLAMALGSPGLGPRRLSAQLRRPMWGGHVISPSGVFKVLRRHGIQTRQRRLSLVAGYASPPEPEPPPEPLEQHLDVRDPGDLVQLDCFHIGRLSGTKGKVWQYTAIDAYSAYTWASVHVTPMNPSARYTSALVHQVARELSQAGWKLKAVSTDNGSEFRSQEFRQAVAKTGAQLRFIHAGRPQSNGCVERVQRTVLEECWRPSFARSMIPKYTALRRDLVQYLRFYNFDRAHTGRHTAGRTPAQLVYGARKMRPR
ncbi:MAG TPA: DDE-type integrase/transposase/recombinase [Candidatus Dormibacteraeota bacterium]|nr:DDE-type integrase/transposase/recombinase [Candidatus Dormibacteraeota bacterium]